MANVLYSNSSDMRLTQVLAAEWRLRLADRFSLLGTPLAQAVPLVANMAGRGSTTVQIPLASLMGVDRMAAVAENASTTPTSVSTTNVTVAVARQALERGMSDLNAMVDSVGYDVAALIADGMGAYAMRWMEMLTALFPSITNQVGTTTVDATADNWFNMKFTLTQNSVPGPYVFVGYPVQVTDIQNDIRGESGPWQYLSDVQSVLARYGAGVIAVLDGVPIIASTTVTEVGGADSSGCMFGAGAFGYAVGTPAAVRGAGEVMYAAGTPMYTEIERDASATLTKIVHNAFLGMLVIENTRAVELLSDR